MPCSIALFRSGVGRGHSEVLVPQSHEGGKRGDPLSLKNLLDFFGGDPGFH